MKKISLPLAAAALMSPAFAFAAEDITDIKGLITELVSILNLVIPLLFALAIVYFIYGIIKYVIASDVKSKSDGRTFIIYGIIGIAVMMSIWGLAYFVKDSFFPNAPTTPSGLPTAG